ncbi:hypothetical protein Tco_0257730 [Tanacetum coccineum]
MMPSSSQEEIPPPPPPPPSSQTPTQQTPHTVSTIKLPILKKGEYDIWAMKMEHYLAHTDYPIWEVIQNGNGPVSITTDTSGQIKVLPPRTAEEIVARERERKARTTLLMALPEDHLAKFHKMTDAKEMWDAIKSRFGGNDESKKMQKYILKQQFEGFSVSNTEGPHKGYDRFQSLLSRLEIHGAGVSTEDANQKFLRSLPSAWSQVSLIMRTKPGVDTLTRSSTHHALTVSPIVSTTFVEQFWTSAKSKTINNVRHITAKVAGKSVFISEASIRGGLLFDDADGIDTLPNQDIFDAIQPMGSKSTSWDQIPTNITTAVICLTSHQKYNFSKLIFDGMLRHLDAKKKFVMYPRFISIFLGKVTPLFAIMLVQPTQDEGVSSERPSEAQPTPSPVPTSEVPYEPQTDSSPSQTSEVPIEHHSHLSPRPSPTINITGSIPASSGENLGGHSSSDKSLSGNEDEMTIQSVYDIFLSLCKQVSDQAKEIQALKAQITKLKKQVKPVIKHHRAYLKSVSLKHRFPRKSFSKKHRVNKESISKQGRKFVKGESSVQRDPLFDEMPEDTVDHMDTENAQDEGRTREIVDEDKEIDERILSTEDVLSTDIENVSTDIPIVSTDRSKVSTDRQIEGTDEQVEGTEEHNEGTEEKNEGTEEIFESTEEQKEGTEEKVKSTDGQIKGTEDQTEEEIATQATQTPTSMIFGDDETIAKVLLNMSQAKAVSKEKEKGVELKDVEETDRPRPTSTRSLLTLKPLPKIDPKDKGKKKIEEEDESESESDGIPQAEKKFKQLESDEELARKVQEEWEAEEERNRIAEENAANEDLIRDFDDIKARIEADRLLAEKLQEQEREQFTIEERAKFLHDTIAAQRKFLAQQRSEAIRNKPPTKNQLRNQMMTYYKHVGNYNHAEFENQEVDQELMNEKGVDLSKSEVIKEESKEEVQEEDKDERVLEKKTVQSYDENELRNAQQDWKFVDLEVHFLSVVPCF